MWLFFNSSYAEVKNCRNARVSVVLDTYQILYQQNPRSIKVQCLEAHFMAWTAVNKKVCVHTCIIMTFLIPNRWLGIFSFSGQNFIHRQVYSFLAPRWPLRAFQQASSGALPVWRWCCLVKATLDNTKWMMRVVPSEWTESHFLG